MELLYELDCEHCGSVYEVMCQEHPEGEQPIYCPFCGSQISVEDIEEDFDLDQEDFDPSIFDDERD